MSVLRRLRIISQIAFFLIFILLFFWANSYPIAYKWQSEWFLRLNPLVGLLTSIAGRSIFTKLITLSVIMALITFAFGRVFCGFICPLGSTIDFTDKFAFSRLHSKKGPPPIFLQGLKYLILIALILMALFGVIFPLFMDPISLFTRIITILVYPFVSIVQADGLQYLVPLFRILGNEQLEYATVHIPVFYGGLGALILVILVLGGGYWDKRFWCQYVCPSGALLGFLSRFAIFRRNNDSNVCNSCKVCSRECPTRAINESSKFSTSVAECIVCGICTEIKGGCTTFSFSMPSLSRAAGPDVNRRHIISGIFGGALLVPVLRADAFSKRDNTGRLIRPPGSVPEKLFSARCIACGECMKVCPTNTIQPCSLSDGFGKIYTPKIVPRIGGCEEKCYSCGQVCPTGAIRELSYEEKRFVKIGTAVIDRHRCLAWEQNKECLVCDEVCPYNAITAKFVETTTGMFKVPVVDEDLCLGCGFCEQHCPIFDEAAIVVYKFAENRRATGPYVSEWQKQSIIERRRKSDDELSNAYGLQEMQNQAAGDLPEGFTTENDTGTTSGESDLPEGFTFD